MNNLPNKQSIIRVATVPVALYKLLKGQLRFINQYYDVKCICSDGNYIDDLREEEGVDVIPIEIRREISLFHDLKALISLYKLFRKHKPDMVHSHTPKAGLLAMLAAKLAGIKIRVHTFTGVRFETTKGLLRKVLMTMDRITCACATEIIPEGDGVKNTLIKYKITEKELSKIANGNINGVDLDYFNPSVISEQQKQDLRNELGVKNTDFVLTFVGRIVSDKGINELASVFARITEDDKNIKLILVGPYERKLDPVKKHTTEILENNAQIIMTGLQQDIRPYLSIADAFVFPSYREGFPNVVLQAGAMGLPCIVSDINGCNEIIKDGYNGLIVPSKNENRLEEAIKRLRDNRQLSLKLKEVARKEIASKFSCEIVWNGILKRYRKLLK